MITSDHISANKHIVGVSLNREILWTKRNCKKSSRKLLNRVSFQIREYDQKHMSFENPIVFQS